MQAICFLCFACRWQCRCKHAYIVPMTISAPTHFERKSRHIARLILVVLVGAPLPHGLISSKFLHICWSWGLIATSRDQYYKCLSHCGLLVATCLLGGESQAKAILMYPGGIKSLQPAHPRKFTLPLNFALFFSF